MRLKTVVAALTLSLICLVPRVSFADSLTLTGEGGQQVDGFNIYPYYMTVTGPGGTNTAVSMSCLNFNREVTNGQNWNVNVYSVAGIAPSATIDGESGVDILADAYLYNQYAGASGNSQLTSDIQFAIWDIMDPGDGGNTGLDANALFLAADAQRNALSLPSSAYVNDTLLIPIEGTQTPGNGTPQMFMTNPEPPALTPEPASLVLLGTGMLGAVAILRRKQVKAVKA